MNQIPKKYRDSVERKGKRFKYHDRESQLPITVTISAQPSIPPLFPAPLIMGLPIGKHLPTTSVIFIF